MMLRQRVDGIAARTCGICNKVWPFPAGAKECFERGLPRKCPPWKPGERLRLKSDVFASRFEKWPPDQNTFVLAGPLFTSQLKRTMHCTIDFHPEHQAHAYRVEVRWMGCAGNIRENRRVMVWAEDLEINTDQTPTPQPVPVLSQK